MMRLHVHCRNNSTRADFSHQGHHTPICLDCSRNRQHSRQAPGGAGHSRLVLIHFLGTHDSKPNCYKVADIAEYYFVCYKGSRKGTLLPPLKPMQPLPSALVLQVELMGQDGNSITCSGGDTWSLRERPVCSFPPTAPISSVRRRSLAVWISSSPDTILNVPASHSSSTCMQSPRLESQLEPSPPHKWT